MHWTEASAEPFLGDWLVAEVKFEGVAVICNVIIFQSVPKPLKYPVASLVLAFSLHLARLIFNQAILSNYPLFIPNVPDPAKELVHFVFWTRFLKEEYSSDSGTQRSGGRFCA